MTDSAQPSAPAPASSSGGELRAALEARGRRTRRRLLVISAVVIAAVLFTGGLFTGRATAQASATSAQPAPRLTLRIATSDDSKFQDEIKLVAAQKGLDVEWVNLNDWVLPNTELVAGHVDGNAFEHLLFLSQFNTKNNADLVPLFSTVVTQWGIFSKSHKALKDIPDGGHIAIPDDPSNGGRALFILQSAGLLKIKPGVGDFPDTSDITANPKHLVFVPIAATTIPQQFDDPSLAAVVVGRSYFDPKQGITAKDALFLEKAESKANLPYTNVVATRRQDANKPAWKILQSVYADKRVAAALDAEQGGASEIVNVPLSTLKSKLADLEKEAQKTN